MEINRQQLKRCDVIAISGRVDSSKAKEVEAVFKQAIDDGKYRFVVDLSDLEYASSAFLRVMITTLKQTKRWNRGNILLAAMQPKIEDVFTLAGLLHVDKPMFESYDTVAEAVGQW